MSVRELSGDINSKDIFLFGIESDIESFVVKYKDCLNIKGIITDHNDELKRQSFTKYGLETLWLENQDLNENSFIIICAGLKFNSKRMRLLYLGLTEYRDFISCNLVDAVISNKQTVVMMGPPVFGQLNGVFQSNDFLKKSFNTVYFSDSNVREPYADVSSEMSHVARFCDYYINASCEKENYFFKDVSEMILPKNCHRIKVTDCGFKGFHPQYSCNREVYSKYFLRQRDRYETEYHTYAFTSQDDYLVELCLKNDEKTVLQTVMDPDFISKDVIEKNYKAELSRLKSYDEQSDIKLYEYYSKTNGIVNRSMDELNADAVKFIGNSILEKMGVSYQIEGNISEDGWRTEMEIYPSVQKYFEVDNTIQSKKYKVVTYNKTQHLDLENYFKLHIEYLKSAIELEKITHTI